MARNQSANKRRSRRMNILRPSDKTSGDGSSSDDLTSDIHSLFELHSLTNTCTLVCTEHSLLYTTYFLQGLYSPIILSDYTTIPYYTTPYSNSITNHGPSTTPKPLLYSRHHHHHISPSQAFILSTPSRSPRPRHQALRLRPHRPNRLSPTIHLRRHPRKPHQPQRRHTTHARDLSRPHVHRTNARRKRR